SMWMHTFLTTLNTLLCWCTGINSTTVSRCRYSICGSASLYYALPAAAMCPVWINASVVPSNADTTIVVLYVSNFSFTVDITVLLLSALPTEVPPNFNTCICLYLIIIIIPLPVSFQMIAALLPKVLYSCNLPSNEGGRCCNNGTRCSICSGNGR